MKKKLTTIKKIAIDVIYDNCGKFVFNSRQNAYEYFYESENINIEIQRWFVYMWIFFNESDKTKDKIEEFKRIYEIKLKAFQDDQIKRIYTNMSTKIDLDIGYRDEGQKNGHAKFQNSLYKR